MDELTTEERALLATYEAPRPPEHFAERTVAELRRRRSTVVVLGAAVAIVLLLVLGALSLGRGRSERGGLSAGPERVTVALGGRGVAVAEAGAALSWEVARGGAALVRQGAGDVFYRVERGGSFTVETSEGTVEVVGTCFRVEVDAMRDKKAAGAAGALLGAVTAAVVTVTVYEGRVEASSGGVTRVLGAGEAAALSRAQAPRLVGATGEESLARGPVAITQGPSSGSASGSLAQEAAALRVENERLARDLEALTKQLAASGRAAVREEATYALTPEELQQLAARCELRWDNPNFEPGRPPAVSPMDAKKLGLTAEQERVMEEELARLNGEVVAAAQQAYAAVTGDENVSGISFDALLAEVRDKTPNATMREIFKRLSAERAGLVAPRADGPPAEQLFRALVGSGDAAEAALAERVGKDLARAYRDLSRGFSSRHRSTYGCPGEVD